MVHQARVDPLVTELVNLASTEEGEVRDSVCNGLSKVVYSGGKNLSESSVSSIVDLISEAFAETPKESYANAIARTTASLAYHDSESLSFILTSFILSAQLPPTQLSTITTRELIDTAPQVLYDLDKDATVDLVLKLSAGGGNPALARPARDTKELMKEREPWRDDDAVMSRL